MEVVKEPHISCIADCLISKSFQNNKKHHKYYIKCK